MYSFTVTENSTGTGDPTLDPLYDQKFKHASKAKALKLVTANKNKWDAQKLHMSAGVCILLAIHMYLQPSIHNIH